MSTADTPTDHIPTDDLTGVRFDDPPGHVPITFDSHLVVLCRAPGCREVTHHLCQPVWFCDHHMAMNLAWEVLRMVTPPDQMTCELADMLTAGFRSCLPIHLFPIELIWCGNCLASIEAMTAVDEEVDLYLCEACGQLDLG